MVKYHNEYRNIRQCTHLLVFTQTLNENTLSRVYGCQRDLNASLCMVNCLEESAIESVTLVEKYVSCHLHLVSKSLNQCYGGGLFPFKLVNHVAHLICAMGRMCLLRLSSADKKHTWLLREDNQHWSFQLTESHLENTRISISTIVTYKQNLIMKIS